MRYLKAKHEQEIKKSIWERHIANSLWNIKQMMGKDEKYKSYEDLLKMLEPKEKHKVDTRTANEIYEDTMNLFKRE